MYYLRLKLNLPIERCDTLYSTVISLEIYLLLENTACDNLLSTRKLLARFLWSVCAGKKVSVYRLSLLQNQGSEVVRGYNGLLQCIILGLSCVYVPAELDLAIRRLHKLLRLYKYLQWMEDPRPIVRISGRVWHYESGNADDGQTQNAVGSANDGEHCRDRSADPGFEAHQKVRITRILPSLESKARGGLRSPHNFLRVEM